jgi:hypothetical protein
VIVRARFKRRADAGSRGRRGGVRRLLAACGIAGVVALAGGEAALACHFGPQPFFRPSDCRYDEVTEKLYCEKDLHQNTVTTTTTQVLEDPTCESGLGLFEKTETYVETVYTTATFSGHAPVSRFCEIGNNAIRVDLISSTTTRLGCV